MTRTVAARRSADAASPPASIDTRSITTLPALERELADGLLPAWKQLVQSDPLASGFQSPGWCVPWYRSYHDEFDPFVVVVSAGGSPVGLVPLAVRRATRAIGFASGTMADYRDIVAAPGHRATVVGELLRVYLQGRFPNPLAIGWIDPASDTPSLVAQVCRARNVPFMQWQQPCHRWLPMDGENLNKKFSRIRTHLNHFKRLGEVTFDIVERPEDWAAFRDTFFQQHSLRQLQADRSVSFDDPRKRRFYDRLFESSMPSLHAAALRLDGELLAGHVGFVWRDVLMLGAPSIALEHEQRSPSLVLLSWIIQHAAELGLAGFDLTIGDTEFKRRLGNTCVDVTCIEVYGRRTAYYARRGRRLLVAAAKASVSRAFGEQVWRQRVRPAVSDLTARAIEARRHGLIGAFLRSRRHAGHDTGVREFTLDDLPALSGGASLEGGLIRENRVEDLLLWTGSDPRTSRAIRETARTYARRRAQGATLHTLVSDGRLVAWCYSHRADDASLAVMTHLHGTGGRGSDAAARALLSGILRSLVAAGARRVRVEERS